MARVHALMYSILALLLAFTCVFAKRDDWDTASNVAPIEIRQPSMVLISIDSTDVVKIVKQLHSVVTEVVRDFREMMSLEPSAESEEILDESASEEAPELTYEPGDEIVTASSTPSASAAPSPTLASTPPAAVALRARHWGSAARSSMHSYEEESEATSELEEEGSFEATAVEEVAMEETVGKETVVKETVVEETAVEEISIEVTAVQEVSTEKAKEEIFEASPTPKYRSAVDAPLPPKQSPKPSISPSPSASLSSSPRPSPSPKEKPLRTLTFGYKGYTDSVVLLLPDSGETVEEMESFVDQLREAGFLRTKFIAVQPNDIWIRSKKEKEPSWFDASDETLGPLREAQILRATKRVMKVLRSRRPTIIGFGQGGAIALTAYMRYGVDGVVSSCGGLPLLSTYPREMTDDSKHSMGLIVGGDHLLSGVERMENSGREVVFLRTNQPKENGRFKDEVIGYVIGVLNRAIAT
ncbi:unnamed protein product [Agarophyton chilense]|eukprot:gb/GEZJ01005186.1/.p1 GENE.gb/GEZJ01005186.1/~~gb/GEZJ01005186.1/.p1  ORF type:complete len:470 (+),score=71.99 gb/GEZJ01005186.1/:2020-3429(+)